MVSEVWLQRCQLSSHAFSVITFLTHHVYGTECLFCACDVGGQSRLTLQTHLINTVYMGGSLMIMSTTRGLCMCIAGSGAARSQDNGNKRQGERCLRLTRPCRPEICPPKKKTTQ